LQKGVEEDLNLLLSIVDVPHCERGGKQAGFYKFRRRDALEDRKAQG